MVPVVLKVILLLVGIVLYRSTVIHFIILFYGYRRLNNQCYVILVALVLSAQLQMSRPIQSTVQYSTSTVYKYFVDGSQVYAGTGTSIYIYIYISSTRITYNLYIYNKYIF
jgi:hypothetical protein